MNMRIDFCPRRGWMRQRVVLQNRGNEVVSEKEEPKEQRVYDYWNDAVNF